MVEYEDRQVQGPRRKGRVRALLVMGACLFARGDHPRESCLPCRRHGHRTAAGNYLFKFRSPAKEVRPGGIKSAKQR